MLVAATDLSAVPGSRSSPGDLTTGNRSEIQPTLASTPTSGWSRNSHIRLATATDVAIVDEKIVRNTPMPRRYLSASTASPTPRTRPIGTVSRANFTVTHNVLELVAAGDVDVLVPAVRRAVLALGVAARAGRARSPGRAGRARTRQDDERRRQHPAPRSGRSRQRETLGDAPSACARHGRIGEPRRSPGGPTGRHQSPPAWIPRDTISTPSPATSPRSKRRWSGSPTGTDDDETGHVTRRHRPARETGTSGAVVRRRGRRSASWSPPAARLAPIIVAVPPDVADDGAHATRFAGTKARRLVTPAERRAELDAQFAIRTAEDVAKELGEMKGVLMKVGQLVSFIAEGLPTRPRQALAALQADAAPMAPTLAAEVVRTSSATSPSGCSALGRPARRRGEHRPGPPGETTDGREVAVKVQFPGVAEAIEEDLDGAEVMYTCSRRWRSTASTPAARRRAAGRMREELDYRLEARNIAEFAHHFAGHPWVRIPQSCPSCRRAGADDRVGRRDDVGPVRRHGVAGDQARAGEVIWRFGQHSIHRLGAFNGDPHPGNYRFHHDGSVTFLDFGLVKRWEPGEWERLEPSLDAIVVHRDPERSSRRWSTPASSPTATASTPSRSTTTCRARTARTSSTSSRSPATGCATRSGRIFDINGPHAEVIAKLNMPPSFVILDRVVWGVSAILGKLNVTDPWRAMLLEYRTGAPRRPSSAPTKRLAAGPHPVEYSAGSAIDRPRPVEGAVVSVRRAGVDHRQRPSGRQLRAGGDGRRGR